MKRLKIHPSYSKRAKAVLYSGDCLKLLKGVPDESFKLIVTSPPYNIGKSYETKLDIMDYSDQQLRVIHECVRALQHDGSICWQVGNHVDNGTILPLDILLYPMFHSLGLKLRNRIVWYFGHGLHAKRRFSGRYETILWFTKSDSYTFNLDPIRVPQKYPGKKHFKGPKKGQLSGNPRGKNPTDIWEIPNVKANHIEKTEHPCQFPIELVERLVLSMTEEKDTVFDPFAGVGSSLIAALMHGRKAVGSEIEPKYVKIAKQRIMAASKGQLMMRPMERPVYDPAQPNGGNIPPKTVQLILVDEPLPLFSESQEASS